MAHPGYDGISAARWEWAIATYCSLRHDAGAETRIRAYYPLMLAWWVARLAHMRYDLSHGRDRRLVAWPEGWGEEIQTKYVRYLELAKQAIDV